MSSGPAKASSASALLLTTVAETFSPGGAPASPQPHDEETRERWRRRYCAALRRLRQAGIETIADEEAAEAVVAGRRTSAASC